MFFTEERELFVDVLRMLAHLLRCGDLLMDGLHECAQMLRDERLLMFQKLVLMLEERLDAVAFLTVEQRAHLIDSIFARFIIPLDEHAAKDKRQKNAPDRRLELERDDAEQADQFVELNLIGR